MRLDKIPGSLQYRDMRPYNQYCPIARAAEILGDRWTILIVREFLNGSRHFNELARGLPGISRTLLQGRLKRLQRLGLLERRSRDDGRSEYHLTPPGEELQRAVWDLGQWGARWALTEPKPEELDPVLLMWWMHRRINIDLLPRQRVVVQFNFHGKRGKTLWLVLEPVDVSVCRDDPGFDVDLLVTADIAAFYLVWQGRISLSEAMDQGLVQVDGPPALIRAFPGWLQFSKFADVVRGRVNREAARSS
jgi:DNA-binding HxlR family transcriptional regulator